MGNAVGLDNASWEVVKSPGRSRADYNCALRWSEAACRLRPDDGNFLDTLGVAQNRAEHYEKALSTLTRSNQLNGNRQPADLAFLAMALHRLRRTETSRATLKHLREVLGDSQAPARAEDQAFLREAEAVVAVPAGELGRRRLRSVAVEPFSLGLHTCLARLSALETDVPSGQGDGQSCYPDVRYDDAIICSSRISPAKQDVVTLGGPK